MIVFGLESALLPHQMDLIVGIQQLIPVVMNCDLNWLGNKFHW